MIAAYTLGLIYWGGIELWRFKEYSPGLNKTPLSKSFKDLGKRSFSTKATQLVPIIVYKNADKLRIISENKGKSGIYRWTNLTNEKSYVGSSVNLSRRFSEYYSIRFLAKEIKKNKSAIYISLLKYGYSNFSVEIRLRWISSRKGRNSGILCSIWSSITWAILSRPAKAWVQSITNCWFPSWAQTFWRDYCENVYKGQS